MGQPLADSANETVASIQESAESHDGEHFVQFYEDDAFLIDAVAGFAGG